MVCFSLVTYVYKGDKGGKPVSWRSVKNMEPWKTSGIGLWNCCCPGNQGTVTVTINLWLSQCSDPAEDWVVSPLLCSALLSSPFWDSPGSAGGKCPALPASDPAVGLTRPGKWGLFLISAAERSLHWWILRRKAVTLGLLAAVGALPLLSLVLILHTVLVCFSSYSIFLLCPNIFFSP